MKTRSLVKERQEHLMKTYLKEPKRAWITDVAYVEGKNLDKPFQTEVTINNELQQNFGIGVHRALGGYHDMPNPGDMLCATLASCFESTLRMIAERIGVNLISTFIKAEAHVDIRGTLMIDKTVPVAFQSIDLTTEISVDEESENKLSILLKATENSCVIYQTLKRGTPINLHHKIISKETAEL